MTIVETDKEMPTEMVFDALSALKPMANTF